MEKILDIIDWILFTPTFFMYYLWIISTMIVWIPYILFRVLFWKKTIVQEIKDLWYAYNERKTCKWCEKYYSNVAKISE